MTLRRGAEIHVETCKRTVGPRGGVKVDQVRVRVSGRCQTWKTRPEAFRLPVKFGLRTSLSIEPHNAHLFHLASDCPLIKAEAPMLDVVVGQMLDGSK